MNQDQSARPDTWTVPFIDTSAIVKLVIHEEAGMAVRQVTTPMYTHELCLGETLGVLKMKHLRDELSQDAYLGAAYYLTALVRDRILILEGSPITDRAFFFEAEDLARKYDLDLADSLQIAQLKRTFIVSRLVTADKKLAKAARAEGFEVWYCIDEPIPADLK